MTYIRGVKTLQSGFDDFFTFQDVWWYEIVNFWLRRIKYFSRVFLTSLRQDSHSRWKKREKYKTIIMKYIL